MYKIFFKNNYVVLQPLDVNGQPISSLQKKRGEVTISHTDITPTKDTIYNIQGIGATINVALKNLKDQAGRDWEVEDFENQYTTSTGFSTASGGSGAVVSVNGQTGAVNLNSNDVGSYSESQVDDFLTNKADLVGGLIPSSQIPSIAISEFCGAIASQAAMIAPGLLTLQGNTPNIGDWCIRSDEQSGYVLIASPHTNASNWQKIITPGSPISSVNGQAGVVVLSAADVGAPSGSGTSTGTNNGDETLTSILAKLAATTNTTVYTGASNTNATETFMTISFVANDPRLTVGAQFKFEAWGTQSQSANSNSVTFSIALTQGATTQLSSGVVSAGSGAQTNRGVVYNGSLSILGIGVSGSVIANSATQISGIAPATTGSAISGTTVDTTQPFTVTLRFANSTANSLNIIRVVSASFFQIK